MCACAMGSQAPPDAAGTRWWRLPACTSVSGMRFLRALDESADGDAVANISLRVADRVGAEPTSGDCVAVAYDGSDASAAAAAFAARLASALGARLTVIHVLADPRSCSRPVLPMYRAVRRLVDAALDDERVDLRHVSAYRLPAAYLRHAVAEVRPALLVVPAPPRARWRTILRPSIGSLLLRNASCPIVVVPPGAVGPAKREMLLRGDQMVIRPGTVQSSSRAAREP